VILVDASVWIDVLDNTVTEQTQLLRTDVAEDQIAVPDLCLFEVLRGLQHPLAFSEAHEYLTRFPVVEVGGESVAVAAARHAQVLRSKGYQVAGIDCLLATYCIIHGLQFLTSDKHFEPYAQHLALKLVK